MTDVGVLRAARLTLRPIRVGDAPAVQEYRGDPDVVRYLLHGPLDLRETQARLAAAAELWSSAEAERFNLNFAVLLGDTVIADVHVWNTEELYQPEPADPAQALIGYVLNPRFQGNGYATEAVGCLISWPFRRGAAVVYANTYADNVASIRLLEHLDFVVDEPFSAEQDESGRGLASCGLKLDRARHVPG